MRLSAGPAGLMPSASWRAWMKRSIGVSGQVPSLTCGTGGLAMGWNDQKRRSASVMAPPRVAAATRAAPGQGRPMATQRVRMAACSGGSCLAGGMCSAPVWRTALISRLLSGSPATTAGPLLPPLSMATRLSRRRPPSCFFGPWQRWQDWTRSGRTSFSKKAIAAASPEADGARTAPRSNRKTTAASRHCTGNHLVAGHRPEAGHGSWTHIQLSWKAGTRQATLIQQFSSSFYPGIRATAHQPSEKGICLQIHPKRVKMPKTDGVP